MDLSRHPNGALEVIGTTTCGYNDVSRSSPNKPVQPESLKGFTFCCPSCMKVYWIKDADSKPARCTPLQLLTYMYVVAKNEDGILMGYIKRNHIAAMRAPLAAGFRPSDATSTPALCISSLKRM
jgi:hypothetical protein